MWLDWIILQPSPSQWLESPVRAAKLLLHSSSSISDAFTSMSTICLSRAFIILETKSETQLRIHKSCWHGDASNGLSNSISRRMSITSRRNSRRTAWKFAQSWYISSRWATVYLCLSPPGDGLLSPRGLIMVAVDDNSGTKSRLWVRIYEIDMHWECEEARSRYQYGNNVEYAVK